MTKRFLIAVLTGFIWVSCSISVSAQCKVKPIVKNCMPSLAPYQYDSYAVKEVTYAAAVKKDVLEFSVYSGEQYKLVFGKTELPQEIQITIYDKQPSRKDKKILYFDESGKKGDMVCNFTPNTTGTYYIEFETPAATAPNQKGCFVVLIGIKD